MANRIMFAVTSPSHLRIVLRGKVYKLTNPKAEKWCSKMVVDHLWVNHDGTLIAEVIPKVTLLKNNWND